MGCAQTDGDVVGQVVAAQRQHERVLDVLAGKDGQIGGAPAEIDQGGAELLFLVAQHGLARGQTFKDDVADVQAGAVAAFDDIVRRGDGPGDDVDLGFETHAGHAHRVLDAGLLVDDVFLRQDVNDFPVHGDGHRPGGIDDALDIVFGDLAALDGHDAAAVETGDVPPGDAGIDRGDLAAGHQFGFLHRFLDGIHCRFDVHHHALAQPDGRVRADADDVDLAAADFTDHAADFGGPDIEAHHEITASLHLIPPLLARRRSSVPPD